ncbi:DUF6527 family protein [Henriciella sp.]|uniref:DUF6527 family protein n=1 Tax=Henriciella sp. TaxID=1968823 RepID=UPI003C7470A2
MVISSLRLALEWFELIRQSRYRLQHSHTQPDLELLDAETIVVVGSFSAPKWAVFRCPGNCSTVYRLSLNADQSPHWRVSVDWLGRPSCSPSIHQKSACHAHFWIRAGRVQQCRDNGCVVARDHKA